MHLPCKAGSVGCMLVFMRTGSGSSPGPSTSFLPIWVLVCSTSTYNLDFVKIFLPFRFHVLHTKKHVINSKNIYVVKKKFFSRTGPDSDPPFKVISLVAKTYISTKRFGQLFPLIFIKHLRAINTLFDRISSRASKQPF